MVLLRGCQVRHGPVGDGVAVGAEGVAEVSRGPQHRGVGDEGETQRLVDLVVEVMAPDVALVSEEQVAVQCVQALALVELAPDAAAEFLVGDVPRTRPRVRRHVYRPQGIRH